MERGNRRLSWRSVRFGSGGAKYVPRAISLVHRFFWGTVIFFGHRLRPPAFPHAPPQTTRGRIQLDSRAVSSDSGLLLGTIQEAGLIGSR